MIYVGNMWFSVLCYTMLYYTSYLLLIYFLFTTLSFIHSFRLSFLLYYYYNNNITGMKYITLLSFYCLFTTRSSLLFKKKGGRGISLRKVRKVFGVVVFEDDWNWCVCLCVSL